MTIETNSIEIEPYYDTLAIEEEELGQSWEHYAAIEYLTSVLKWMFHDRRVAIGGSINLYQASKPAEKVISPDIVIIEDVSVEELTNDNKASYYIGSYGSPPPVVFEVSSAETWRKDLEEKPEKYAKMGVIEYFAFDPNPSGTWIGDWRQEGRLLGWRKSLTSDQPQKIAKDESGRMWSEQLESWLIAEGRHLHLYSANGSLRLTETEAAEQRAEVERRRAEATKRQVEAEQQRAEAAEHQIEAERRRAEATEHQIEAERQHTEKLTEILRRYNIDPDNLP